MVETSRQNYVRVPARLTAFCSVSPVQKWTPHRVKPQRQSNMRSASGSGRRDPEQLGRFEHSTRLLQFRGTALGMLNRASSVVASSSINHSFYGPPDFPSWNVGSILRH